MNDLEFNLNSIKSYKNTFISSKNYYANTSYSTYTSSYLKYCSQSDSTVAKMVKNLDSCYSGITSSYLNILSWWNNFILNIEGIENTIKGGPQTISDSSLKSYINIAFQSLPNLNVTGNSSFSSIDQSKLSNIFSNNLDKKDDAIEEAKKKDTKDKIKSYLKSVFSINNINDKEETKELTEDEEYAIYIEKLCSTKLSKIEATHDEMNELIKALVAVQVGQTNFTEEQQSEILKYLEKNNKDYYSYVENPLDTPKSVATNMLMSAASALGYVDVNEDESLADSFKNVGASIGTAVTGAAEGVADFLTDVGATLEYGAAAVLSIGTGVYDLYQCIDSNITGEDKVYITPEVWKSALEINSENKKTNDELENSFYDDTTVGQALKDNASNFENIRNISSQFGYEASIVALSILSGGLAGAASGTAATATTTAKSVTSIAMGASAATASFGKHSTEAYTSGASVGESLAYGAGNAAIDYLTHWGGAKVNGISVMAGESGLSNIMNSIARVSVDAAAAGAEYTARTGLQSAFIGDKTFAEQWDANGGWSGFGQTVLTAGAFSAFGEIMDNISKVISTKAGKIMEVDNVNKFEGPKTIMSDDSRIEFLELDNNLKQKLKKYNEYCKLEKSQEYIDYLNSTDSVRIEKFDDLIYEKEKLYSELMSQSEIQFMGTNKYKFSVDDINDKYTIDRIKKFNSSSNVDVNIGKKIEQIISEDNDDYIYGIHWTTDSHSAESIMENGIYLTGDLSSGIYNNGQVKLSNNISFFENLDDPQKKLDFIKHIQSAGGYKSLSDEGYSMIVKIPKAYLEFDIDSIKIKNEFFNEVIDNNALNNKFVIGKIAVKSNGDIVPSLNTSFRDTTLIDYDPEFELSFFKNKKKQLASEIFDYSNQTSNFKNLDLTEKQIIKYINSRIKKEGSFNYTIKSTSEISSTMLSSISDLDKLSITLVGTYEDFYGNFKIKYDNPIYYDRITYTGYEALSIISKIEQLASQINLNATASQKAYQIYKIISEQVPTMYDFKEYVDGHKISASLRGLTPNNTIGKEGLVCAGYATLYKELCDRVGVKCDYIRGVAYMDPLRTGKPGGHAWNVVVDERGLSIPVDSCWGACGQTDSWFGASDDFELRHVADSDELFKDYKANYVYDTNTAINYVKNMIEYRYGEGMGLKYLMEYYNNHDISLITRTGGARDLIQSISYSEIAKFLNSY